MDIDQFLEKDIINFLEGKVEKKDKKNIELEEEYGLYLTRDYVKEVSQALENDEISRAKRLYNELYENYSKLPDSSLEKNKIWILTNQISSMISEYEQRMGRGPSVIFAGQPSDYINPNIPIALSPASGQMTAPMSRPVTQAVSAPISAPIAQPTAIPAPQTIMAPQPIITPPKQETIQTNFTMNVYENKTVPDKAESIKEEGALTEVDFKVKGSEPNDDVDYDIKLKRDENLRKTDIKPQRTMNKSEISKMPRRYEEEVSEDLKKLRESKIRESELAESKLRESRLKESKLRDIKLRDERMLKQEKPRIIARPEHANRVPMPTLLRRSDVPNVNVLYEKGVYSLYNRNYSEAKKIFETILEKNPNNKAALIRLQQCTEVMQNG